MAIRKHRRGSHPGLSLLSAEPQREFSPTLALRVGLNEAIMLQQIRYWLMVSGHRRDGEWWIYNTIEQWQAQFPWWSKSTIWRVINSLVEKKLLIVGHYGSDRWDRTSWYTINYPEVDKFNIV